MMNLRLKDQNYSLASSFLMKKIKIWLNKIVSTNDSDREVDQTVTEEEKETRREMFDKYEAELRSRELSNSQQYDKAILTLSSAGITLSVTAFKTLKENAISEDVFLLVCSWWLFVAAITLSLVGFVVGNKAIRRQIKFANDYYIQCFKDAGPKTSFLVRLNSTLNILAGITFLTAIGFTITFFTKTA